MKKHIFFAYGLFICTIIVLADLGRLPLTLLSRIPHYDWIAHLILYGLFYGLLENLLRAKRLSLFRYSLSAAFFLSALLITAEEISQIFFETRTFSFTDLGMGFLGVFLTRNLLSVITGSDLDSKS